MRDEVLNRELQTKLVYNFVDTEANIDTRSKEIFKKRDVEVHFPRHFEGGPKYTNIRKISFHGFDGNLPVGVIKSPFYGYGFTRTLWPFAQLVDKEFKVQEVVIKKGGSTNLDRQNKRLYLGDRALRRLQDTFAAVFANNKAEVEAALGRVCHELFPSEVHEPQATYVKNSLSQSIAAWGNKIDEFSEADKAAVTELFNVLSSETEFLTDQDLLNTKVTVDVRLIENALQEFDSQSGQTTETATLEKKWQSFLRKHAWVFSAVFAQPVILFKDEAYAGGKNIDNLGGKFSDFLIKNSLSDNVAFVEIKTHITQLVAARAYRGDDVFSTSKDLAGSVNQVLKQREAFQKTYAVLKMESEESFESINSACYVIIGSISSLTDKQKRSFELHRSNSRDVEILTFDEVRRKIELLRQIISDQAVSD